MRGLVPGVRVDYDSRIGAPSWVRSAHGFLSGPQGSGGGISSRMVLNFPSGTAYQPTKAFLLEHEGLFGHGPEILESAQVKREFTTPHNGLQTVVWEQQVDGIPVFEGLLISHTTAKGELVSLASHFLPRPMEAAQVGMPARAAVRTNPPITARQAVALAAQNLGEKLETNAIKETTAAVAAELRQRFQASGLNGETETRLVWLPFTREAMRLCWEVLLTSRARGEMYRVLIDVETGEALLRHCLTEYLSEASYRVFPGDSPTPFSPGCDVPCDIEPPTVERSMVTWSALDTKASPSGWIDDGVNETRGNNVLAHTDRDFNNEPDLPRPQGDPFRVFDYPLDLGQFPSNYVSAAVTELFFWCNWMHDRLYALGFDEAAGNFQTANFGRGGFGDDALLADAHDGLGLNNANMSTPPDGAPGRIQLFLFNGPKPHRDGDLDHEVVLHEYTHGLSNRRVGGGVGISELQSRGLGEGWSDFYALALLSEAADEVNAPHAYGAYAAHLLHGLRQNYYFGVRRYPYSTDLTKSPLTFKDIDPAQAELHASVPRSPVIGNLAEQVHNQGEVWCAALWEARANLIARHGHATGNQLILQLVTDGMNLSPANPNFLQARDAILLADLVNHGGANLGELWAAFAKRGMGHSAVSPPSATTFGVVEAFDVPDGLLVTLPESILFTGPVGGPFRSATRGFTLVNVSDAPLYWMAAETAAGLKLSVESGVLAAGKSSSVVFALEVSAGNLAAGSYTNFIHFTNLSSGVVHSRKKILRIGLPDHLTEWFEAQNNDLDHQTLTFTPDGSADFYSVCREPAAAFPTDPTGGENLLLGSHAYLELTTPHNISLYGRATNVLFLNSEGHVTLVAPDPSGLVTFANHFSQPRVSASAAHLHPTENGGEVSWLALPDRVAITFSNAWEFRTENYNHFQIELFYDGRIRLTHLATGSTGGLVGLSRGDGTSTGFIESDLSGYGSCMPPLKVSVSPHAVEGAGLLSERAMVRLAAPVATNLTVSLGSSDAAKVVVPVTVILPAGEASVPFELSIPDDKDLDGPTSVNIAASASGYVTGEAAILVGDNDHTDLSLEVSSPVQEGNGTLTGVVRAAVAPQAPILVSLISSDPTELQVSAFAILSARQTTANFKVTVINDPEIDGEQVVTLKAQVPGWLSGVREVTVRDDEFRVLTINLPAAAREGDGALGGAGSVSIAGTYSNHVVVRLVSSDTSELLVPPSLTIVAGRTNAAFSLIVVNDPDSDGPQQVTVTANAADFDAGTGPILINDDESPPSPLKFLPSQSSEAGLRLVLGTLDGSPITQGRVGGIQLWMATNLDFNANNWIPVNFAPLLTNGVLHINASEQAQSAVRFFRAGEIP